MLRFQAMGPGIEDRDLRGEILRLENDRGSEVRERAAVGNLPSRLHGLGRLAEERLIAFAADRFLYLPRIAFK